MHSLSWQRMMRLWYNFEMPIINKCHFILFFCLFCFPLLLCIYYIFKFTIQFFLHLFHEKILSTSLSCLLGYCPRDSLFPLSWLSQHKAVKSVTRHFLLPCEAMQFVMIAIVTNSTIAIKKKFYYLYSSWILSWSN